MSKKIPGIYNFCDRWCERCAFTSRCAVYENTSDLSTEEMEISNKAFWDKLSETFDNTRRLLRVAAEQYGLDLDEIMKEADAGECIRLEQNIRHQCIEHPVGKLSLSYGDACDDWLKSQPGIEEKVAEIQQSISLGTTDVTEAKSIADEIKDSVEVIAWYHTLIHVKLMRAMMGRLDDEQFELDDDFPRDHDGSAKVAIIAIERSTQAWLGLYKLIPEGEDLFLKLLGMLEKLRELCIQEFPEAMAFKRPGFDD